MNLARLLYNDTYGIIGKTPKKPKSYLKMSNELPSVGDKRISLELVNLVYPDEDVQSEEARDGMPHDWRVTVLENGDQKVFDVCLCDSFYDLMDKLRESERGTSDAEPQNDQ